MRSRRKPSADGKNRDVDRQHGKSDTGQDGDDQKGVVIGQDIGLSRRLLAEQCQALRVQQRLVRQDSAIGSRHLADALGDDGIRKRDVLDQGSGVKLLPPRDEGAEHRRSERPAKALGGLNLIGCNAGLARGLDKIESIPEVDLDQMMDTNVKGLVFTIQAGLPHVRTSGGGHVILIGSTAGHATYEGGGVYCASKHGVKALAQTLRLELCGEPIRVTSIDPGMAETEFSVVRFKDEAKAEGVYKGMHPLQASDIAECVRWVAALPAHVNIDEIIVKPTDQGSHTGAKVHRRA